MKRSLFWVFFNAIVTTKGDKVDAGIWGPFPLWNADNYAIPKPIRGVLRTIKEKDDGLVFRLTPVLPTQIESNEKTDCDQLIPMSAPQVSGSLRK